MGKLPVLLLTLFLVKSSQMTKQFLFPTRVLALMSSNFKFSSKPVKKCIGDIISVLQCSVLGYRHCKSDWTYFGDTKKYIWQYECDTKFLSYKNFVSHSCDYLLYCATKIFVIQKFWWRNIMRILNR